MDYQGNYRGPLTSIPERKLNSVIQSILESFPEEDGKATKECVLIIEAVQRYAAANIPVDYWFLSMDDFVGDKILVKKYNEIIESIDKTYSNGDKYCFAGKCGIGKTYVSACVLKKAVEKGYSAFYTTLADIIMVMSSKEDDKFEVRKMLMDTDFLVIDEFDPRFMGSENAAELYGRIIEPILRSRVQNKLPLLLCSNNSNPVSGFTGALKESISSLMSTVQIVPVLGKDHRPEKKKNA